MSNTRINVAFNYTGAFPTLTYSHSFVFFLLAPMNTLNQTFVLEQSGKSSQRLSDPPQCVSLTI